MATYGEGDPTDNAQEFYDWLKETSESLNGLRYTVRTIIIMGCGSWKSIGGMV